MTDWKRGLRRVLYPAYEARLVRRLPESLPRHVGVMLDGNRRWAKAVGRDTAHGHRAGAANIEPLLGWCDEIGIEVVTLWLLSTDNLNRPASELEPLLAIIADAVDSLADQRRWRLNPVGALDLLPSALLTSAAEQGLSLEQVAAEVDVDAISEHLYTRGQPDPDLVIRTSGEQRLGGFLLWQSEKSEFYFCEAYWPDFRRVDFLRAVRAYAQRERRFGA